MGKRVVTVGLIAIFAGNAWAEPPQAKESPTDRAGRVTTFVDKTMRWDRPDGSEGTFRVLLTMKSPRPSPFPAGSESVTGPIRRAARDLDHAIRLARMEPEARASDAASRGFQAFMMKDYEKSKAAYDEAIRLDPGEPSHYSNAARVRLILGENERAVEDLGRAIVAGPERRAEFLNERAKAWTWLNRADRALADTDEAIRVNPKFVETYTVRAMIRASRGDYDGALADLDKGSRSSPPIVDATRADEFITPIMVNILKRDTQSALALTEKMVRRSPNGFSPPAWFLRMELLSATGEYDQALEIADRFVVLSPENHAAWLARAEIYREKKDYDRANADCDIAMMLSPKASEIYEIRSTVWEGKREYRRALTDLEEAIRIAPNSPSAIHRRAWLLATCPDASVRDTRAALDALRQNPPSHADSDPNCLETFAAIRADQGDFDAAVRAEQDAITRANAPGSKSVKDAQKRLALYQAKRPYRDDGVDDQVVPAGHVTRP